MISSEMGGLLGLILLVILLFSRVWIGTAMAFVGMFGYMCLEGFGSTMGVLTTLPYSTIASYTLTVLPLFMLMGNIVSSTGICGDLYETGHKWMGALPGGLAIGTIGACAGFAAICGSSLAAGVTMGRVALPEMKRHHYSDELATGCVASGATLGILIPPSLGFILYGILTEESIGLLFMSGIVPGIILSVMFMLVIYLMAKHRPETAPPGSKIRFREKVASLKYTWPMVTLFLIVMGGIYWGLVTPTEAGAIGAFGAILISTFSKRLSLVNLKESLLNAGEITGMISILIIGAYILARFLAVSGLPFAVSEFVSNLGYNPYIILGIIILFYILLGMFLDIMSAVILTIPIIFPTVKAMGFDPIWFGVIIVLVMEMGMITPPVGLNVFILAGVSDVPVSTIFRGVIPFVLVMLACIVLFTIFPGIVLFLPKIMP